MGTAADAARSKRKDSSLNTLRFVFEGRTVFLGSAFLGLVLIFLSEPFNSPIWFGVIGPITVMLLYMALGLTGYVEIADSESFADSIYYLGFLLTLVSLSAALFYLRHDKEELELGLLVSKFGLALLTTIIGLCVRVAIVNFRVGGSDAKRAADERLSHAMDRFTNDIELTCEKIELLLSASVDLVTTTAAEVSQATTQATKAMQEETIQTSAHMKELHLKSEKQWGKTITKLSGDLDEIVRKSTDFSIDRLKELNEKIHTEMDSFQIPQDIVTKKIELPLDDLATGIKSFSANLEKLKEASVGHQELRSNFDELGSALAAGTKTILTLDRYAENLTTSYKGLQLLSQKFDQLNTQLSQSSESLNEWGSAMDGSMNVLDSGAEAGRQTINALTQEIRDLVVLSQEQSDVISTIVRQIASAAEDGQEAMILVQKNLIDSSRVIVDNLKS